MLVKRITYNTNKKIYNKNPSASVPLDAAEGLAEGLQPENNLSRNKNLAQQRRQAHEDDEYDRHGSTPPLR